MVERREKELTIDDMHYLFGHFACTPTVKEKQKESHKEITYKCIFYFNDGVGSGGIHGWKIIKYFQSIINAYSFLSHELWVPL